MIPDTNQAETKKKSPLIWVAIAAIIVFVVIGAVAVYNLGNLGMRSPQVKVLDIEAERYGTSLFSDDCRAKITAFIQNYGDVDAYVTVKFTAEWAGESHTDVATVFVRAHSTSNAVGDVQATTQWFNYRAEIIEVRAA